MIEIDRLLAQAEAQQTSDIWEVLNKYRREVTYVDDDGYVNIVGRKIDTIRENVSVQGEQYSQYIEFLMDRFYDGVDLAEHTIAIHYEVEGNGGEDAPINVYKNSTQLKFGWLIGPNVAQYAQPVEFCIWVRGTLINGNKYVLKTLPQIYTPKRGLVLGGGIPKPDNNWYLQFSLSMDEKVNQSALNASHAASSANEARTAEIVILQAQQEVSQKSEVVDTQYKEVQIMHQEAEQYRDEALQFRNEAEQFTPDGYDSLVEQVNKNTVAVNTIVEKADLGMKETASGEEIYLFDSSNGKPPEFYLFGKATQNTTSGKNKLKNNATSKTINGVTFTVNKDGSVTANGTHNLTTAGTTSFNIFGTETKNFMPNTNYLYSIYTSALGSSLVVLSKTNDGVVVAGNCKIVATVAAGANSIEFSLTQEDINSYPYLFAQIGVFYTVKTVENLTFKPMIRLASIEDDTYEPYTGGIPSPNPDYKQDIEVAGESYNLLENTATSQTVNGIEFVVNEDKSVTANGVSSSSYADFDVGTLNVKAGESYTFSGISDGSDNSYRIYIITNNKTFGNDFPLYNGEATKTATVDDVVKFRIQVVPSGYNADNLTFYPMIRKASIKNNRYMPYGKGSVEVKSVGKNLFKNTFTSRVYGGITFVVKDDGSIEGNGTCSEAGITAPIGDFKLPKGKYIISGSNVDNSGLYLKLRYAETDTLIQNIFKDAVFEVDDETVIYRLSLSAVSNMTLNSSNNKLYPMIRLATEKDTTYEPYKETLSTILTTDFAGIKVGSNGNYTDQNGQQWIANEIVKYADGSGEKIQRIKKVIFDGSEDEAWNKDTKGRWYSRTLSPNAALSNSNSDNRKIPNALCNSYQPRTGAQTYEQIMGVSFQNNTFIVYDPTYGESDKTAWTTYLSSNPVTVYYELAEPIITPLTSEELAEIEKLHTFYQVTNISNDFDCGMKVTYVVDAKTYVDNKIAQIAAAVVNNI